MSDLSDNSALKWIRSELDLSLETARNNLERYIEDEGGDELIEEAIANLHQVCGTLQLVQIYGAAMLAEEMELVSRGLRDDKIKKRDEASEALMLGLVQLPEYLEKLEAGATDSPLSLLPLLNEMRVAREAQLLSEIALFAPGLDDKLSASADDIAANEKLPGMARNLRHRYHKALLDWYRDIDAQGGLRTIARVFDQLESTASSNTVQRLFRVAQAAVLAQKFPRKRNNTRTGYWGLKLPVPPKKK